MYTILTSFSSNGAPTNEQRISRSGIISILRKGNRETKKEDKAILSLNTHIRNNVFGKLFGGEMSC